MEVTRGYAFVWKEEGFSGEEIRPALRRVLADLSQGRQQEHEARKAMARAFALETGMPDEMLWEPFLVPAVLRRWCAAFTAAAFPPGRMSTQGCGCGHAAWGAGPPDISAAVPGRTGSCRSSFAPSSLRRE